MGDLDFETYYQAAGHYTDNGLLIKLVHYKDLISAKKLPGDLNDLENLES